MNPRLAKVLADKGVQLWWADETWTNEGRRSGRGWIGVADVSCNLRLGAVAVPRRRRGSYHFAEVLHEVAHLLIWRDSGKTPTKQSDVEACVLALDLGKSYGFSVDTLGWLQQELAQELEKMAATTGVP